MIKYLKHEEIDKTKWDLCIEQSLNSMVYAYSWYLDEVSTGWDALVLDDYQAVFPLPHSKKIFRYVYQPFFVQQLGLFYKDTNGATRLKDFIKAIPAKFRLVDIQLNEANALADDKIRLKKRRNYVLDLEKPYQKLFKEYNEHNKRNVKKARKFNLNVQPVESDKIVDFYVKHKGLETEYVGKKHYQRLKQVLKTAAKKNTLHALGVFSEDNELLACGAFLTHHGRIIYLVGVSSEKGREQRGMYFLFDHLVLQYSEQKAVLDFEGSEIPGIARFFKGFGARKVPYFSLRINRLPWLIRWIKN